MTYTWIRWGARFTVTPPEVKAAGRKPGGPWQPRDWHGKWIKTGYRVQIAGYGRSGTVQSIDGPNTVTVAWDDGAVSSISSKRLRVTTLPDANRPHAAAPRPGTATPPNAAARSDASARPDKPQAPHPSRGWPSIDELTPRIGDNPERLPEFEDHAQDVLAATLSGQQFAGYTIGELSLVHATLEPDPDDPFPGAIFPPYSLLWSVPILRDGQEVGDTTRVFGRDPASGTLWVEHKVLVFRSDEHQGTGFAPAWNGWLEQWYRASGVREIRVQTGLDVGGYAWARHGFDFADEYEAQKIIARLQREVVEVKKWLADYEHDDLIPDVLYQDRIREINAALDVLDAAGQYRFGEPGFPSAYEISQVGRRNTKQNPKTSPWIGARAMLGSSWKGVKPL